MTAWRIPALAVGAVVAALFAGCASAPPAGTGATSAGGTPSGTIPRPAESAAPDLDGRIIFTRAGGAYGDESLFIANADGTEERRITEVEIGGPARLSPDGSRVLVNLLEAPPTGPYTGGTVPIDGGLPETLTLTDSALNLAPQAWSPDGTRIAFEGWDDDDPSRNGLYTARFPDGGDLQRLTSAPNGALDTPADWSPDGRRLVLYRHEPGAAWDQDGTLWLVNADGTDLRQIDTPDVSPSWWARFSPDGTRILFGSARLSADGALWTVDANGSNLTRVFTDADGRFPITPDWSADGTQILFALSPINDEWQHPANEIYVVEADGRGLTLVIGGPDFKREIEWVR